MALGPGPALALPQEGQGWATILSFDPALTGSRAKVSDLTRPDLTRGRPGPIVSERYRIFLLVSGTYLIFYQIVTNRDQYYSTKTSTTTQPATSQHAEVMVTKPKACGSTFFRPLVCIFLLSIGFLLLTIVLGTTQLKHRQQLGQRSQPRHDVQR